MTVLRFEYPAAARHVWEEWSGGEKILKLAGAVERERLWLVESWGTTQAEYEALEKASNFTAAFYPAGADFTIVKCRELPDWVKQHRLGLPYEIPKMQGSLRSCTPSPYVDSASLYDCRNSFIASFQLSQIPTCCGLCLSSGTLVYLKYWRKGIGSLLMELKEKIVMAAGYSVIMGTLANMEGERRIWRKFGWREMSGWTNRRSGNTVVVGQKELTEENAGRMVGAPKIATTASGLTYTEFR